MARTLWLKQPPEAGAAVASLVNLAQCYIDLDDYASALKIFEEIPEDKRTDSIRAKIAACREILEASKPESQTGNQ